MKKTNILYWVFTALFAAAMVFSAIPDIMMAKDAVTMLHDQMGYPNYLIPFLGWAKLLGVLVILVPGFPRLTEWAYAGLVIDLVGATYSVLAIGTPVVQVLPMLVFFGLAAASYYFYHKRLNALSSVSVPRQRKSVAMASPISQEA